MIEDRENYGTIASGLSTEQQKRIQLIRDSIEVVNRENKELNELVAAQKEQINHLRDSLRQLGADYETLVSAELKSIEEQIRDFKIRMLGHVDSLSRENRSKDEQIQSLQQELILKEQQIDSLNQLIIEKNSTILLLTQRIQELQSYIDKVNAQLPETLKAIEEIKEELLSIDKLLGDSNVFNRKKRMKEAQTRIRRVMEMYERLNQIYETDFFNPTIAELAHLENDLTP